MTDGISFDITANDKTSQGVNSAIGNINKLGTAGGVSSPATIMDKWTKSQYAAAQAGGLLTNKAIALSSAIDKGKMTIAQATKEYAAYEKQVKGAVWQQMSFGEKLGVVRQRLEPVGAAMLKIGAAAAVVGVAGKQIYQFGKAGAELQYTQVRFERLSQSMGTTGTVFMNQLRQATKGTVSDMDLARNSADLFQLGLARTSDEAIRLSKVQTALGMDTGELTLALANQSKRRLDQLGLSLTKFNEIEAKLKGQGMSKEDAFREAFMQTAEYTIATTGNKADSAAGDYARLEAGWANMLDAGKMKASEKLAPTISGVSMFMQGMASLMKGDTVWDMSGGLGADSYVRAARVQDKSNLWTAGAKNRRDAGISTTGLSAAQNYTAMAYAYQNGVGPQGTGKPQGGAAAEPLDYMKLVGGAMQLTKVTEQYADMEAEVNAKTKDGNYLRQAYKSQQAELKDELKAGKISTDEYNASMKELNQSYKDGTFAQEENQRMLREVGAARSEDVKQIAFQGIDQEAVDPEVYYETAAAMGYISEEAADTNIAISRLNDSLTAGTIKPEQYAKAVDTIGKGVAAMDGMSATAFITVYMKTVGGNISSVDLANAGNMNAANNLNSYLNQYGHASGFNSTNQGYLPSGLHSTGEQGEEGIFVDGSGRVRAIVPAGKWREFKKYGIQPGSGFANGFPSNLPNRPPSVLLEAARSVRGGSSSGLVAGVDMATVPGQSTVTTQETQTTKAIIQNNAQNTQTMDNGFGSVVGAIESQTEVLSRAYANSWKRQV